MLERERLLAVQRHSRSRLLATPGEWLRLPSQVLRGRACGLPAVRRKLPRLQRERPVQLVRSALLPAQLPELRRIDSCRLLPDDGPRLQHVSASRVRNKLWTLQQPRELHPVPHRLQADQPAVLRLVHLLPVQERRIVHELRSELPDLHGSLEPQLHDVRRQLHALRADGRVRLQRGHLP